MNKWMDENTNELNRIMMMMKTNGPKFAVFLLRHIRKLQKAKKMCPGHQIIIFNNKNSDDDDDDIDITMLALFGFQLQTAADIDWNKNVNVKFNFIIIIKNFITINCLSFSCMMSYYEQLTIY